MLIGDMMQNVSRFSQRFHGADSHCRRRTSNNPMTKEMIKARTTMGVEMAVVVIMEAVMMVVEIWAAATFRLPVSTGRGNSKHEYMRWMSSR